MIKKSYGYIANKVAEYLELSNISKLVLVFGSIFPDYYPDKLHTYDNWFKHFNYIRYELMLRDESLRYWYLLGKELHLCADFFTRVHNCDSVIDFFGDHHAWELELHTRLISDFVILDDYSESISQLHKKYLEDRNTIDTDVSYISMAISSVVNKI